MKIRALAHHLPSKVDAGGPNDPWGVFWVGTGARDQAYIDAFELASEPDPTDWELCNKLMHKCFDYNISSVELAKRIRRGPMGVLALSGFVEFMFSKRGVDLTPLSDRFELLIDALQQKWVIVLFVWVSCHTNHNISGACLPDDWKAKSQRSDWSSTTPSTFLDESLDDNDNDNDDSSNQANQHALPPHFSPRKSTSLNFGIGNPSGITVPKKPKKISPLDEGSPEYDYGVFGFEHYDPLPSRQGQQYAKGPISHADLEILAHTARTIENHIRFLSGPDQLNRSVQHIKAMLYRVSDLNSEKRSTPYNAFVHNYRMQTNMKGTDFITEATNAYKEWKGTFEDDASGWDAACKELVAKFDMEKADLIKTANEWSDGHSGIMTLSMDKLAHEVCVYFPMDHFPFLMVRFIEGTKCR